jgi:PadR family transcriptional regulator
MNLIQGTLDLLVLKAVAGGPRHGYEVARWVRETTDDTLRVEDGALYAALHRLEERGGLTSDWGLSEKGKRAKYYVLTPSGRRQLESEKKLWAKYAAAMQKVVSAPEKP